MSDKNRVLEYMRNQNRPYNLNDILSNLHNEIGKTILAKCLDSLVEEGDIFEKTYGKQKVYLINQNKIESIDRMELNKMKMEVKQLEETLCKLNGTARSLELELKKYNSALTTDQAKVKLQEIELEIASKSDKLEKLMDNKNQITTEDKNQIIKERNKYLKEWIKRKRIVREIMDSVLENYPKKKKEFCEEVGIELDEESGAVIPNNT